MLLQSTTSKLLTSVRRFQSRQVAKHMKTFMPRACLVSLSSKHFVNIPRTPLCSLTDYANIDASNDLKRALDIVAGKVVEARTTLTMVSKAKLVHTVSTAAANDDDVTECLAATRPDELNALQAVCSSAVSTIQSTAPHQTYAEAVNFEAVQRVCEALWRQLGAASQVLGGKGVLELVQGSDWQADEPELVQGSDWLTDEPDDRVTFMQELLAADSRQFWDMMAADIETIKYIAHAASKLSTADTQHIADTVNRTSQDGSGISNLPVPQVQVLGQI